MFREDGRPNREMMFREDGGRPNDQRGFLHKSFIGRAIGGAVKRFIPAVGLGIGAIQTAKQLLGRGGETSARSKQLGRSLKFGGNGGDLSVQNTLFTPTVQPRGFAPPTQLQLHEERGPCLPPLIRGPEGLCIAPTSPLGASRLVGQATMGQYGAALIPGSKIIDRAVCLPGMQLAKDGLCYNKGAITNSQRMWPKGRRPLLTGGDMRAIGVAARAGAKLDRTTKRLRALGMMKKLPTPRKHPALKVPVHRSVDV